MLLKHVMQIKIFGFCGSCCMCDSILLVKDDQSTSLQHHLPIFGTTVRDLILWLMRMAVGSWSELPIGSAGVHDVLVDQLNLQSDKSGTLLFPEF